MTSADAATRVAGAAVTTAGEVLTAEQAAATLSGCATTGSVLAAPGGAGHVLRSKGADYERWIADAPVSAHASSDAGARHC